jgi:hypothetical protein
MPPTRFVALMREGRASMKLASVATLMMVSAMLVGFLWPAAYLVGGQSSPGGLPASLSDYITKHIKLTHDKRTQLLKGQPVTQLLEADPSREVAVFGAVWVNAAVSRYIAAVRDIEQFEKGESFLETKRISSPPRLEDFAALRLPPDDMADLKACKVGSCELKLGEDALLRIRKEVDWSKPTATTDVESLFRRLALEYVNGYLEGGNARLAAYRDSSRPTFISKEFSTMIERMPSLTEYLPALKRYLLEFPKASLAKSESFLYWQEAKFGLKPTIRINHLTIAEEPTHVVVVSKMLYASHYFWTAIELRVLALDPAGRAGFWFASVNRSRSDGLSGFVGSLVRGKVRSEAEKGMQAALRGIKAKLEHP